LRAPKAQIEEQPKVLGFDASGIVESVGDAVTLFKSGDAVYYAGSVTRAGSNAQFQLVDERIVGPKPKTLDFAEAAALPLTALTAWELLFDRFGFAERSTAPGPSLLVLAGAGGLGSITIQLARHAGLTTIATASRVESAAWCRQMGAQYVIDHHQPLREQLQGIGFRAVDAIGCFTGAESYWPQLADIIAPQGRIGLVVGMRGPLDLELIKSKSASVHWEFMFTRSMFGTPDLVRQHEILARVAELVDNGQLRTTWTQTLGTINAQNLREAHRLVESGATIGKITLVGW
jgi:NADPH2:quinone reductase